MTSQNWQQPAAQEMAELLSRDEAVQALVPAIGRSCSTNDWLSNSIGAAIGAALAALALRLAGEPASAPPSSRTVPTRRRTTVR